MRAIAETRGRKLFDLGPRLRSLAVEREELRLRVLAAGGSSRRRGPIERRFGLASTAGRLKAWSPFGEVQALVFGTFVVLEYGSATLAVLFGIVVS